MAKRMMALVKMDPAETKSTGGVVEEVIVGDTELDDLAKERGESSYDYSEKQDVSGYKLINCGDDVKVGWIYADKTNVFVDSNSQA